MRFSRKWSERLLQVAAKPVDWLLALILSWAVPLELFGNRATYFTSLTFWVIPIALLFPRFLWLTDAGAKRRRRAFWWTTVYVFLAGTFLDLVLGSFVLDFSRDPRTYVYRLPFGQNIPVEEFLFYLLGGMAIVLVYFWADEFWMRAYHVRNRRWNDELFGNDFRLVDVSPAFIWSGIALIAAGFILQWWFTEKLWPLTWYYNFLVVVAVLPALFLYRSLNSVINWRAFSFTCLYVLVTSCIWEVTLGLSRSWWFYRKPNGVLGFYVSAFSISSERPYPIEALIVWLVVTFDAVLGFEALKGITHDRRSVRAALFGSAHGTAPPSLSGPRQDEETARITEHDAAAANPKAAPP